MKSIYVKSCIVACISIILMLSLMPTGCSQQVHPFGFKPILSISEPPVMGKPVTLKFTFDSPVYEECQNKEYHAKIELSPGYYEVVEGDLEQRGKIIPGETHALEVTIKSIRTGNGTIYGRVSVETPPNTIGDYDVLFISIYKDYATVSETQPTYYPTSTETTFTTPGTVPPTTNQVNPTSNNTGTTITPGPPPTGANAPSHLKVGLNPILSVSEPPVLGNSV
jgi:hypothetical protein